MVGLTPFALLNSQEGECMVEELIKEVPEFMNDVVKNV